MLFLRRALTLIPLLAFHALAAPALSPRVCIDAFPSGATNGYISAWIANGSELYDANNQPYTVYQFRATCTIGSVFFNILDQATCEPTTVPSESWTLTVPGTPVTVTEDFDSGVKAACARAPQTKGSYSVEVRFSGHVKATVDASVLFQVIPELTIAVWGPN